jgi:hypothetical protein
MKKILFYAMTGEKMCFQHVLMNALDLHNSGHEVKIIFEGASVKLPSVLQEESNPLFGKALKAGLVAGICFACSKVMGVFEVNQALGLPMLDDMYGHAGMKPYLEEDYEVVSM